MISGVREAVHCYTVALSECEQSLVIVATRAHFAVKRSAGLRYYKSILLVQRHSEVLIADEVLYKHTVFGLGQIRAHVYLDGESLVEQDVAWNVPHSLRHVANDEVNDLELAFDIQHGPRIEHVVLNLTAHWKSE